MKCIEKFFCLAVMLFLAACSSPAPQGLQPADPKEDPQLSVSDGFSKAPPQGATKSLLREAKAQQQAGLYKQAIATTERLVRLHPDEYQVWQLLIELNLQQKNYRTAEQLSNKVLVKLKANDYRRGEVWMFIARAREGRGEFQSAHQARSKAREY